MNSYYSDNRGVNRIGIDFINNPKLKYNIAEEPEVISIKEDSINQSHIKHGNYRVELPYFDLN